MVGTLATFIEPSRIFPAAGARERDPNCRPVRSNDQHRRGGTLERVQITDRKVPGMKRRPGTIAGPRSRSSRILALDSSRTLLILVFHGLKRESPAPLAGWYTHWQTLDGPQCFSIAECARSAGERPVCDAHDAPPNRLHAARIKSAVRPQLIPRPLHSVCA